MMKYLLVEDERFAYEEMKRMMEKLRPDYQLEAWTATVEQTVQFLKHHPVDLMLLDIRLTDGNSFDIFEQIQVTTPVIFTTAYDEYALKAFEVNSIDYLLKPVSRASLQRALDKLKRFSGFYQPQENADLIKKVADTILRGTTSYKTSLLVSVRDKLIPVKVSNIAYIYYCV